jgi:hypothetical protein
VFERSCSNRYFFLLPPLAALLRAPPFEPAAPLFFAPPLPALPLALLVLLPDLFDAAADEAAREAVRVAVRVVFSAALAVRLATLLAARVCLRTCFVFSLAALLTASLTPLVEAPALRDLPLPLGRMASAAVGLTMPITLAADSIMPVATLEAWSTTSLVTLAAWFKASPAMSIVASTGPRPRPFLLAIAYLFLLLILSTALAGLL